MKKKKSNNLNLINHS